MQYPVPQFQDVEDKIIGPLTFKQFVYLLGGAGLSYVLSQTVPKPLNMLLIASVMGFSAALAFYKIHKRPLIDVLEAAFYYYTKNKLYLWKHRPKPVNTKEQEHQAEADMVDMPNISESKIKEMAWSLDINERIERVSRQKSVERARTAHEIAAHNVLSEI